MLSLSGISLRRGRKLLFEDVAEAVAPGSAAVTLTLTLGGQELSATEAVTVKD